MQKVKKRFASSSRSVTHLSGFSMIEILVVVTILGILGAVGFLSMRTEKTQVIEVSRVLATDLIWARSEAVRRNENVIFEFLTINSQPYYQPKYRVYVESDDADSSGSPDNGIYILQRNLRDTFPKINMFSFANSSQGYNKIRFDVRGIPSGLGSNGGLTWVWSNTGSSDWRCVFIEPQGRVTQREC